MVNLFKKLLGRGDGLSLDTDKPLDLNMKSDTKPFEADFENEFGSAKTTFGEPKFQEPMTPPIRDYRDSFQNKREPLQEVRLENNDLYGLKKDIEVISSKLDALRSAIESINQRLINIERIAMTEQQQAQVEKRREW